SRLAARAGKAAVAVEQQQRIALRDRRQLGDEVEGGDPEPFLARLAGAEDLARAAEAQILLGDAEAVAGLAHQGEPRPADLGQGHPADQQAAALARAAA